MNESTKSGYELHSNSVALVQWVSGYEPHTNSVVLVKWAAMSHTLIQ